MSNILSIFIFASVLLVYKILNALSIFIFALHKITYFFLCLRTVFKMSSFNKSSIIEMYICNVHDPINQYYSNTFNKKKIVL